MSAYIKLAEPPEFVLHYPTCSACDIELEHDGDSFSCPSCGTSWDPNATDGDKGELYSSWSGEEASGPSVTPEQARAIAQYRQRVELNLKWPELFPRPAAAPQIPGVAL